MSTVEKRGKEISLRIFLEFVAIFLNEKIIMILQIVIPNLYFG